MVWVVCIHTDCAHRKDNASETCVTCLPHSEKSCEGELDRARTYRIQIKSYRIESKWKRGRQLSAKTVNIIKNVQTPAANSPDSICVINAYRYANRMPFLNRIKDHFGVYHKQVLAWGVIIYTICIQIFPSFFLSFLNLWLARTRDTSNRVCIRLTCLS